MESEQTRVPFFLNGTRIGSSSGVRLLSLPMSRLSPDVESTRVGCKKYLGAAQGKDRSSQQDAHNCLVTRPFPV